MKNRHQFFYDNKWSNCPLSLVAASHKLQIHVSVCLLTINISQRAGENFGSYRKTNIFTRAHKTAFIWFECTLGYLSVPQRS